MPYFEVLSGAMDQKMLLAPREPQVKSPPPSNTAKPIAVVGEILSAQSVHLSDFSAELDPDEIEVSVIGVGYPLYGELFPSHVAAYEAQ